MTARGPAFFYANEYVDLSIFTQFFSKPLVRGGTYVEIGGSNGVHASNTLFFEQHLNWTGVLIEPTPCGRCVLPYTRPNDLIINAAACASPANLTGSFMASDFCPPPQDACVRWESGGYAHYKVQCLPMHMLLPRSLTHVDFFSIDVEEHVMGVLETIPWSRISIDVLLAECRGTVLLRACTAILRRNGFRVFNGIGDGQDPLRGSSFGGDVLAVREACISSRTQADFTHGALTYHTRP